MADDRLPPCLSESIAATKSDKDMTLAGDLLQALPECILETDARLVTSNYD
jgi:hypothetical protein